MVFIDKTTQVNLFTTLRSIITNNSTLNKVFNNNNILQFEQSKLDFKIPQIIIDIPDITPDDKTLGKNPTYSKDFDTDMTMRIEYDKRDNFRTYMNTLINAIEADNTMETLGYILDNISNSKPVPTTIYDKNLIEVVLTISYKGEISYG